MGEDGQRNESWAQSLRHIMDRVYIDPIQFPKWCADQGTMTGRQGRKMFVAAAMKEKFGN
jgi:hypothetical protein